MTEEGQQMAKVAMDVTSVGTVVATIMGYLPAVAALLTIVWTVIRIYETETFQKWMKKARGK